MAEYHPQIIKDYFDLYAEKEWERLIKTPLDEIKLAIHSHYLQTHVPPGSRVLEVGAGPGRFTQLLAALGCRITVLDISPVQLDLNRKYAGELGFAGAIEGWHCADICDLSNFADAAFDALVCYGGPLSYVLDQRDQALTECVRVTREGGPILISVMSLWGTVHAHLRAVLDVPMRNNRLILESGDLTPHTLPGNRHDCHMYRAGELRRFLERQGLEIQALSASNALATGWNEQLVEVRQNPELWSELLAMEIEASQQEGCLDIGTHLIAVVRQHCSASIAL